MDDDTKRTDYLPPDPDRWLTSRLDHGAAIIEAFPGDEPGTYGATLHLSDDEPLEVEQGAAAIEAVMVKLMEGVTSPAEFAVVQQAIVARLAGVTEPAPPTAAPGAGVEPPAGQPEGLPIGTNGEL